MWRDMKEGSKAIENEGSLMRRKSKEPSSEGTESKTLVSERVLVSCLFGGSVDQNCTQVKFQRVDSQTLKTLEYQTTFSPEY